MRGLYVHIPFCSVKCYYCDFVAVSGQNRWTQRYLQAVSKELARCANSQLIDTLYVGGGTPSELSPEDIRLLLESVEKFFGPISDLKESSFEANPESLTPDKIGVLRDFGVSRLSLGLQAVQDRHLKNLGRQHTFADFSEVFERARKSGMENINVDLMFALPDQTAKDWEESLKAVEDLSPEHVSLYGLQVEEKTVFAKRKVEADEELGARMYETARERLSKAGFRHYEISNFAKPGFESVHNQIYWRNEEYAGAGCGACSYLGGVRSQNETGLRLYCEKIEKGQNPAVSLERLEGKDKLGESAFLGLRLVEGFALTPEMEESFKGQWESLEAQRLVRKESGRVRLTERGLLLANQVFQQFV